MSGKQIIGGIEYEPFSDAPKLWSQGDGSVNLYRLRERNQDGELDASGGWGGQRILYSYDKASRMVCEENNDGQCVTPHYDVNGRLTGFDSQVPGVPSETYEHDANGNRTAAHGGVYGDRRFEVDAFSNRLNSVNGQPITYDAGGNIQNDGKNSWLPIGIGG